MRKTKALNQFENELLGEQLRRYGKNVRYSYNKVLNLAAGKKLFEQMPNLMQYKLNVIVYNFVDMLSHARTEMEIIRELASDEEAYRSLMLSWFEHSSLYDMIRFIAQKNVTLLLRQTMARSVLKILSRYLVTRLSIPI